MRRFSRGERNAKDKGDSLFSPCLLGEEDPAPFQPSHILTGDKLFYTMTPCIRTEQYHKDDHHQVPFVSDHGSTESHSIVPPSYVLESTTPACCPW